jgi:hypothetical protein
MRSLNSNFLIRTIFAAIIGFVTCLIQNAAFAQSDPDYWIDPITVTARPYRPPSGFGMFPTGGGGSTSNPDQGTAGEEEKIRRLVCTRGQAAYNQAGCQAKPLDTTGLPAAVDSAVSRFSWSPLFAASVQTFAQSLWSPSPGSTLRTLIGSGIRDGANQCKLQDKPVPSCINQVLIFYGINSEWVPLGEVSGVDVNDYVNRMFDGLRDFNNAPVGSLIKQFNLGGFCKAVRDIAAENKCSLK